MFATDEMREWATGRSPWWRLAVFVVLFLQVFPPLRAAGETTLFSGIIFGAHEFGHLFFAFFGEWMSIAGGSLMQLLIPIGAAAVVYRSRDWFGIAICGIFLAASLADLSWYIADARAQEMDLVSFSPEGAVHDWNYLLHSAGMIGSDTALARLTRFIAFVVLALSAAFAARLLYWMKTLRRAEPAPT